MEPLSLDEFPWTIANFRVANAWQPYELAERLDITLGQQCRLRVGKGTAATCAKPLAWLQRSGLHLVGMPRPVARFDRHRLKPARGAANLRRRELARLTGPRPGTLSASEGGTCKPAHLRPFAQALGPGTDCFFSGGRMEADNKAQG